MRPSPKPPVSPDGSPGGEGEEDGPWVGPAITPPSLSAAVRPPVCMRASQSSPTCCVCVCARAHACMPAVFQTGRSCCVLAQGLVLWVPPLCSLCLNKQPLPLSMVVRAQFLRITGGACVGGYVTVLCPPSPRFPSAFLNRGAVGTGATKKCCCMGLAQRLTSIALVFRKNSSKGMPLGPFLTLWSPKMPSPLFQSHCRSHPEIRGLLPK